MNWVLELMAEIIFNPKVAFNGRPILCQLFCENCDDTYCGAWRNDWISTTCRECGEAQVKPIVSYEMKLKMIMPGVCSPRYLLN